jgi:hypothetical protein
MRPSKAAILRLLLATACLATPAIAATPESVSNHGETGADGQTSNAANLAEQTLDPATITNAENIASDCENAGAACFKHFQHYERRYKDHSASAGFNLFGIIKGSGLNFWGYAEELNYTEIVIDNIEYQIGFGYMLYAKQRDGTINGSGMVASLATSGTGSAGQTIYSTELVGIAPGGDVKCDPNNTTKTGNVADQLLCTMDMQPTVTETYFQNASSRLAIAYDNWRQKAVAPAKAPPDAGAAGAAGGSGVLTICPQVINFRSTTVSDKKSVGLPTSAIVKNIRTLDHYLSAKCNNVRPNARIDYKTGTQGATMDVADGEAKANKTAIVQGYYRNRIFLADTPKRQADNCTPRDSDSCNFYVATTDHSAELSMSGLTDAAKLPSVLASIVSYTRTDADQKLLLLMRCSGGAVDVDVSDNPASSPQAFTNMVNLVRAGVDGNSKEQPCLTIGLN